MDDVANAALIEEINAVIAPFNCAVIELGADSVGVQGDARVVGPSVIIRIPPDLSHLELTKISNEITNKVRPITRVLVDITPE